MKNLPAAIGAVMLVCYTLSACVWHARPDVGKAQFDSKCATCHGLDGKGDGPQAEILPTKPADLTVLAKMNDGVFPTQRIYDIIDGRLEVAAHGPRTMPVWGRELQIDVPDLPADATGNLDYREDTVQGKIQALIDYLVQLQVAK